MINEAQFLTLITSVFYLIYMIVKIYNIEDVEIFKYQMILDMTPEEKRDFLIKEARETAVSDLSKDINDGMTEDEKTQLVEEASKYYIKLTVDEDYLEENIIELDKTSRKLTIFRWLKISIREVFVNLYLLISPIVLMLTGSNILALMASIATMVYYSVNREEYLMEAVSALYGEETAEEIELSFRGKMAIIGRALLLQSYILIFIFFMQG